MLRFQIERGGDLTKLEETCLKLHLGLNLKHKFLSVHYQRGLNSGLHFLVLSPFLFFFPFCSYFLFIFSRVFPLFSSPHQKQPPYLIYISTSAWQGSQNATRVELEGTWRSSTSTPALKAESAQQVAQSSQINISKGGDSPVSLGSLFLCLATLTLKRGQCL